MLTQKQENYAINLFKGMSQREAYVQAGYSSNMLPEVIDANACRLAKDSKVLARLKELNAPTETDAVMTVAKRKERLSQLASEDIESKFGLVRTSNIQAISELNKMDHVYEEGINIKISQERLTLISNRVDELRRENEGSQNMKEEGSQ